MSIYIAHRRRKTSNALDTLVLSEQECFPHARQGESRWFPDFSSCLVSFKQHLVSSHFIIML